MLYGMFYKTLVNIKKFKDKLFVYVYYSFVYVFELLKTWT